MAAQLPAGGALRRERRAGAGPRRPCSTRRAPDEREPACERRRAATRPRSARLSRLRRGRPEPGDDQGRGHTGARSLSPGRRCPQPGQLPALRAGRDGVEPARRRLRGHGPDVERRDGSFRRRPVTGRPRHGDPLRAPLPGLAGGLSPHRQARPLQLLRGLHPHRRLDVQPAREVAEGDADDPVASSDRVAQLPAVVARLAPGSQRLLASGPRLHRPRREQEGRDHPRLPAARCEHPPLGRGPLPAEPPLRERDRRREAAGAELPVDGGRDPPLHARPRHLGVGFERRRGTAGRRPGLRRRRTDPRDHLLPPRSSASTSPT